ncbi:unnamed protein product [Boreogadus saida]
MVQSSLASVLGHLAQTAERQTQLQQAQNEVLVELARSLATDREAMRELLGSGEHGGETRPWRKIYVPKMGEADDPEAFLDTFRGVAEPGSLSAAVNIAEGHLAPPLSDRRPPSPRTGAAALQRDRPTPGPRWGGCLLPVRSRHPIPQTGT